MAHNYIIQWNYRGLRSNREDIELLISKYSPAAMCLQETMLKRDQIQTFKHYSAYYKKIVSTDMVESVFLSKTTSFIAKFNFKLIYKPLQFV